MIMKTATTSSQSLSILYLKSLGYIFSIAFLSYYAQYPALSSRSGIEPSERVFRQAFPTVYQNIIERGYADADSFVELVNVLGVLLSVLIASGVIHHGLIFLAVTTIYHFLYVLGTSFYSFQWDILLIETGFLTGICFAPWQTLTVETHNEKKQQADVGSWPIRFLLFKLMFMSGVVKIQANCPTWQNLTALEFHFATQCLPGPLAWYAHQLPPLMLRLGVAATFVIEIPAAFLLLAPSVTTRKVGAWLQILLQMLIIFTGSYNFFNLLTMALCLPCMIGEENTKGGRRCNLRIWNMIQLAFCTIFLSWACREMFVFQHIQDSVDPNRSMIGVKLAMTKYECNLLVDKTTPITVACTLIFTAVTGIRSILTSKSLRRWSACSHALVCCMCIMITAVPLFDLSPSLSHPLIFGIRLSSSTWRNIRLNSRSISHGYGLFRRMTGVGQQSPNSTDVVGWAGLPPSIVARPEIIFEALVDNSQEWRELKFRWKPGDIHQLPLQAAPHQPRFDWKLWFGALGTVQHNPWLVSFTNKILQGCPTVLDLLDEPDIATGKAKITRVRADLYHYDFTRLDTEWANRIPGTKILAPSSIFQYPDQVWTRSLVGQYLPSLDPSNPSLREFLQHSGYGSSICVNNRDRCKDVGAGTQILCQMARFMRKWNATPWVFPVASFLVCCILEWAGLSYRRNQNMPLKDKLKLE